MSARAASCGLVSVLLCVSLIPSRCYFLSSRSDPGDGHPGHNSVLEWLSLALRSVRWWPHAALNHRLLDLLQDGPPLRGLSLRRGYANYALLGRMRLCPVKSLWLGFRVDRGPGPLPERCWYCCFLTVSCCPGTGSPWFGWRFAGARCSPSGLR